MGGIFGYNKDLQTESFVNQLDCSCRSIGLQLYGISIRKVMATKKKEKKMDCSFGL
jgi:hypothetical protein